MNGLTKKLEKNFKITWEPMKMRTRQSKPLGCSKDSHRREVYSSPGLPKEGGKVSNKQPKLMPKRAGKSTGNKAPKQQKKGNSKD